MLPYKRVDRVKKLLHKTVSELIYELKSPNLPMITITDVKLMDNFDYARIFFSLIGDKKLIEKTEEYLNSRAGFIRHRLGEEIRIYKIPALTFVYDETYERAERIFSLLKNEVPESPEKPLENNENK